MSKPSAIATEIIAVLEADATVAAYCKAFFKGVRERVTTFPCIMLEKIADSEIPNDAFNIIDQELQFALMGFVKVTDPDKQFDQAADFANMIKNALELNRTLNGKAIMISFPETHDDFQNFPVRSFVIGINVINRQTFANRL